LGDQRRNASPVNAHIRQALAAELLPGTVAICGNLATYRNKHAAQAEGAKI